MTVEVTYTNISVVVEIQNLHSISIKLIFKRESVTFDDVWYVDHLSFALDLKILFLTVMKVIKPEGISAEGSATMEKFTGTKQ